MPDDRSDPALRRDNVTIGSLAMPSDQPTQALDPKTLVAAQIGRHVKRCGKLVLCPPCL